MDADGNEGRNLYDGTYETNDDVLDLNNPNVTVSPVPPPLLTDRMMAEGSRLTLVIEPRHVFSPYRLLKMQIEAINLLVLHFQNDPDHVGLELMHAHLSTPHTDMTRFNAATDRLVGHYERFVDRIIRAWAEADRVSHHNGDNEEFGLANMIFYHQFITSPYHGYYFQEIGYEVNSMYRPPAQRSVRLKTHLAHLIEIVHFGAIADVPNKTCEQHQYIDHWNHRIETIVAAHKAHQHQAVQGRGDRNIGGN